MVLTSTFTLAKTSAITTAEILAATTEALPNCLEWELVGKCFWLDCGIDGCGVNVTTKVRHYLPDFVVGVHLQHQNLAWEEMNALLRVPRDEALQSLIASILPIVPGGGGVPATNYLSRTRSLRFFEADIFGHPITTVDLVGINQTLCLSETQPLLPYYQSLTDAIAWREAAFDISTATLNPLAERIGTPLDHWGYVKPRCGWIDHVDPNRAAAVAAYRALHVLTHDAPLRVKVPLLGISKAYYQAPNPVRVSDAATGSWQMIHPIRDNTCNPMGKTYLFKLASISSHHNQSYLWNVWRSYTCCNQAGSKFLGDIDY